MKKIISILLTLVILNSFTGFKIVRSDELPKDPPDFFVSLIYSEGIKNKIFGRYDTAIDLFKSILTVHPDHHASLHQIGSLLEQKSEIKEALKYSEKAYLLDTTNSDYLVPYLELMIHNQEYSKADSLIHKLIASGLNNQRCSYYAVTLALTTGKTENLASLAKTYIDQWGYNPTIMNILSDSYINSRKYEEFEQLLEHYQSLFPEEPGVLIALAKLKAGSYKNDEALSLYKRAITLDPSNLESLLALSEFYRLNKNMDRYIESLLPVFNSNLLPAEAKSGYFRDVFFDVKLLKEHYPKVELLALTMYANDPENREIEKTYLDFLLFTGNLSATKSIITKKLDEKRADIDDIRTMIEIETYYKNYDTALWYASEGAKLFPDSHVFPYQTAIVHYFNKDYKNTFKYLKTATAIAESDSIRSSIFAFEGDVHYELGNRKKAYTSYDKALKYNPDNVLVLNNYAYFLSEEDRNLDKALRMSKRVNELEDGNATYLDTYAWILYKLGRYEEARTSQRRAIALSGDSEPVILMHYGDILYALGEDFLAQNYWEKALKAGANKDDINSRLEGLK